MAQRNPYKRPTWLLFDEFRDANISTGRRGTQRSL